MGAKRDTLPIVYDIGGTTLVGTVHLLPGRLYDERFSRTPKQMAEIYVDGRDGVAFELEFKDIANVGPLSFGDGCKATGMLEPHEFEALGKYMEGVFADAESAQPGMSQMFRELYDSVLKADNLPMLCGAVQNLSLASMRPVTIDATFYRRAKKLGIRTIPLESVEEQMPFMKRYSEDIDPKKFADVIRDVVSGKYKDDAYSKLYIPYVVGDIDALMASTEMTDSNVSDKVIVETLLDERNPRMYERSVPLFNDPRKSIVVGAAHCPYITEHAASDGFSVKRLS